MPRTFLSFNLLLFHFHLPPRAPRAPLLHPAGQTPTALRRSIPLPRQPHTARPLGTRHHYVSRTYQFEYIDTTHCPPNLVDTLLIIKERIRTVPGPVVAITVPCQDSIIYRRDTALETLLKEQLSAGDATIRSLQRKADRLSAWRWVACALLVGWILLFWVSRRKKA
jgi:hypothetical protein